MLIENLLPLKRDYSLDECTSEAAVLAALFEHPSGTQLILTKRAGHLNSHAGEVSLPGGKWEPGDVSPAHTALRETHEEIDLPPDQVQLLGQLPPQVSKHGLCVTPVVGWLETVPDFSANPDELDAVFTVPLSFFVEDQRVRTDIYSSSGITHWSPAWHYQGFEIWGLTARIVVNLLNRVYGAGLKRANRAPENLRQPPIPLDPNPTR